VHRFEVWAPRARRVEVEVRGARHPLEAQGESPHGGVFAGTVEAAGPGDDYAFRLDGGRPLPDPRSPWQPAGVHGPSRLVDHAAFVWTDAGWRGAPLAAAALYELHVGTFTREGTFDAAIARLPHLVDLGVTAVELMPVAAFPGTRGWGYDGVALFAPHHAYGGPEGLKRLVDACHAHGLAVVMDVVYNHLGPDGNYLPAYGPYFTDRHETPWGEAVNFDGPGSLPVRRFVLDNAAMWLRHYHCDGLRLDAVHAIVDTSAFHILEELAIHVGRLAAHLGRTCWVIAESDLNDPRLVRAHAGGGYGLDAQWSDDFHHALHAVLTGERDGYYEDFGRLEDLATALRRAYVYAGRYSRHRDRRHGRPPLGLDADRFLGFIQNHDQVGNRATGDRLSALTAVGRQKIAAALVLTAPFVPMLFQGEEWGARTPFLYFTDHGDPALADAVRDGRRREFVAFGWKPDQIPDPQAEETWRRSQLDWTEPDREPHRDLLAWHRGLLRLRRTTPALAAGGWDALRVRCDEAAGWLVVERGPVTIAANVGAAPVVVPLGAGRSGAIRLASDPACAVDGSALRLPADSVAILA
jgi:maltooligosyltrehalose trehalohydrolase